MNDETEEAVVAACQAGDQAAYAGLVQAYSGRIFAICLGMLGHRCDAEDMTQQALLKGFIDIRHLREADQFGPWIARIARNLCVDALRRRKCRATATSNPNRPEQVEQGELYRLEAALDKLGSDHRVPLLLFYFDGRSTESIAATLGISRAAVQARLSRGRKQLRKLLQAEGEE